MPHQVTEPPHRLFGLTLMVRTPAHFIELSQKTDDYHPKILGDLLPLLLTVH